MTDAPRSSPVNFTWQNSAEIQRLRETHDIYMVLSGLLLLKAEHVANDLGGSGKIFTLSCMSRLKICICKTCKCSVLLKVFLSMSNYTGHHPGHLHAPSKAILTLALSVITIQLLHKPETDSGVLFSKSCFVTFFCLESSRCVKFRSLHLLRFRTFRSLSSYF